MEQVTKRLIQGQDLRQEIQTLTKEEKLQAAVALSIVGSVSKLRLRVADGKTIKEWNADYELASGTGTLSTDEFHIHISASDISGTTVGGHLSLGCVVKTTAEIVLLAFDDVKYERKPDSATGYDELSCSKAKP